MTDAALEVSYTRAVVDLLLQVLVPSPHLESRTGRFVVGELITCNVLLPFIARLSDPDWLNGLIIQVCGGPDQPEEGLAAGPPTVAPTEVPPSLQEATCLDSPHSNHGPPLRTETEVSSPESAGCDVTDAQEALCPQNTTEEEPQGSCLRGSKSNLFYEPEPDSPFVDCNQLQTDSLVKLVQEGALCVRQKERSSAEEDDPDLDGGSLSPMEASCPRLLVSSGAESLPIAGSGDGIPRVREASSPPVTPSRELHLGVEQSSPGNLGELGEGSPLHSSSSIPSFSFDPLSSPEGPVIIQNLRITGTITAKEHRGTGSHPYTLYTIKVSLSLSLILKVFGVNDGSVEVFLNVLVPSTRRRWAVRIQAAASWAQTAWTWCWRPASTLRPWPTTRSTGGTASSSTCRRGWRRKRSCGSCSRVNPVRAPAGEA